MERLPHILGSLIGCGIKDVVVEVNMNAGVHYLKAGPGDDGWLIVAGKEEGEWRGRATAVRRRFGEWRTARHSPTRLEYVWLRKGKSWGLEPAPPAEGNPDGDRCWCIGSTCWT